jgi:hypothetical protein
MTTNPYEASRVAQPLAPGSYPANGTPTEIEFEFTLEDYVAFCHEHSDRLFSMRAVRTVLALLVGLAVPVGVAIYLFELHVSSEIMAFLIAWAIIHFLVFLAIAVWWTRRTPAWATAWYVRWYATRRYIERLWPVSNRAVSRRNPRVVPQIGVDTSHVGRSEGGCHARARLHLRLADPGFRHSSPGVRTRGDVRRIYSDARAVFRRKGDTFLIARVFRVEPFNAKAQRPRRPQRVVTSLRPLPSLRRCVESQAPPRRFWT